jgi:hypothetical protein
MKEDIIALCNLGKIQTNRLTKDIVWNSLFIDDYENRYGIDANVVSDFADGYIEWLCEEFEEEIDKNNIDTVFRVLDREVRNNKGGYSFYDYTNYMVCID